MKSFQDTEKLSIENVWEQDVGPIRGQVLGIWKNFGIKDDVQAEERLRQLVFVVKNNAGEVVGLSTAFRTYLKQVRATMFACRLLLVPGYRVPGLTSRLLVSTRDFLESRYISGTDTEAIGLVTLVENRRLIEKRNEAVWPASGMVFIGNSPEGYPIRVYYFKGARISP